MAPAAVGFQGLAFLRGGMMAAPPGQLACVKTLELSILAYRHRPTKPMPEQIILLHEVFRAKVEKIGPLPGVKSTKCFSGASCFN
jgi:hypothetical protein